MTSMTLITIFTMFTTAPADAKFQRLWLHQLCKNGSWAV